MRVLLVGFGSVGRSVASLLATRRDELYRSMGLAVRLVGVVDSRGAVVNAAGLDERAVVEAKQRTGSVVSLASGGSVCVEGSDAATLIKEVSADVLVEATPSMLSRPEAGLANLKAGMSSRKHVITVNKAPLALAMPGLVELARHNRVEFRYSGSVGAGTPVLATARRRHHQPGR